ncbi:MAG: glycosyltransferase [Bacteroidales bacterium]|nr:glycosyltransferase [Bacteroidales bacterium]
MKILVVLPRFPYPLDKGDKLRAYHQVVELSKRHEIYLFCVSHDSVSNDQRAALAPYCREICVVRLNRLLCYINILRNWFAAKSLQMGYWNTSRSKRLCRSFANRIQPDVVYNQMVRTMPLVARLPFPKVMDFQDALSLNTERRMDQSRGLWHYILHFEFKMLRSSEYNAFSIFDALTIISETDSEAIPHKKNGEIQIVPNGVDLDYFNPLIPQHGDPVTYDIVFCGNMSYAPNIDAARYLVEQVMPLVWQKLPATTVLLAGTDPKRKVRSLADDRRIHVPGRLPDIRTAYSSSHLFVAPMRIGSGLQNKLLEAMAIGLPCVTTSIANAALGAVHGQQLLLGDTAQDLADSIVTLLTDDALCHRIADQGHSFVTDHYNWDSAVQRLENVLAQVCKSRT